MKAFQLLRKGCLGQRRRIDDLNRFHVVDEQVEAGLPAAACRAYSVSRSYRLDQRDPPADDRAAEGDIDDEYDRLCRRRFHRYGDLQPHSGGPGPSDLIGNLGS